MINKLWILLSDQVRKSNHLVLVGLGVSVFLTMIQTVWVDMLGWLEMILIETLVLSSTKSMFPWVTWET